jgi:hypothetical protein
MIEKVVIIGAGNVATRLIKAIINAGIQILQIVSRTAESARELGTLLNVPFTCIPTEINTEADLYIVSVKDDAIAPALSTYNLPKDALIVHTAGSVSMEILKDFSSNIGILYPLQTFSKKKDVNFKEIPVYIEANNIINTNKEGQELPANELLSCPFVLFSFSCIRPRSRRLVLTLTLPDRLPEKVDHGYSFCYCTLPQVLPFLFRDLEIRCPAALTLRPS